MTKNSYKPYESFDVLGDSNKVQKLKAENQDSYYNDRDLKQELSKRPGTVN